ncbi:MAG TPA: SDR family NAD(P)-dependent oxidoreductase [Vicinamibacterales bacterium]
MTVRTDTHDAPDATSAGRVLVTGGAGFIGTNLAGRLAASGRPVVVLDTLSRAGVERNARWLRETYGDRIELVVGDVRQPAALERALDGVSEVYHLAAQVAVTTSLDDPLHDFDVNARGTLTLLEAIRRMRSFPTLLFTSTNKVYGALEDVPLARAGRRYRPVDETLCCHGVDEERPLAFHSPYGCSKGSADQYVLDYARTFGLPAAVLRMSCIYGPHQHGNEDQGWVAHFLKRALAGEPLVIYGDGCQVRDVLYIDDLVDAFLAARAAIGRIAGRAFNIGGGPDRAVSLLELIDRLEGLTRRTVACSMAPWRAADQRYYVSDCRRFARATGWTAQVSVDEGLTRLAGWLQPAGTPDAVPRRLAVS